MWNPSDALLADYLAGHCTDADAHAVEQWLVADAANRSRLEELRVIWQGPWPPPADVDAMWKMVRGAMGRDRARTVAARPAPLFGSAPKLSRPWVGVLAAVAAVVLLVMGGSLVVLRRPVRAASIAALSMRDYVTPRGQRATFQLSDGTRLVLAPASRLRIPAAYGRRTRDVYLEGEALFDVVHDSARPFRVHVKGAVAEDIGTRFDVRAYAEDSAVAVAVAEGAVALGRAESGTEEVRPAGAVAQGVVLRKGSLGMLTPDGRVMTRAGPVVEMYFSWVDGRLHFSNTPLPEVLRVIGRWYDLDVRVGTPALAARAVTADLVVRSPDALIQALASALGARATRAGRVVTLGPKS